MPRQLYGILVQGSAWYSKLWLISNVSLASLKTSNPLTKESLGNEKFHTPISVFVHFCLADSDA